MARTHSLLVPLLLAFTPAAAAQFTEVDRIAGLDGEDMDRFGQAVDLEDDLMVVGAYGDDDFDPSDPFCISGAAYVFERQGGVWFETAKLTADDAHCRAFFGSSVATDGERIVVGAYENDRASSFVGAGCNNGAAYVFARGATGWALEQRLAPAISACGQEFGYAVAIEGDTIVASAPGENIGSGTGAVYVFEHGASGWAETQQLVTAYAGPSDRYGRALALEHGTLVVGSRFMASQGRVEIFGRDATGFVLEQTLSPLSGLLYAFGSDVALSGDTLAVSLTGGNAPRNAVDVYGREDGVWNWVRRFNGPNRSTDTYTYYGSDIDLDGDTLIVGDDAADDGDGSQTCYSGAVYVYERTGPHGFDDWHETYLTASVPDCGDHVGIGLALDGDRFVAGADFAGGASPLSGAAHVFERAALGTVVCTGVNCPCGNDAVAPDAGCLHSGGEGARVVATGSTSLAAGALRLRAQGLPEDRFALFVVGVPQTPAPLGDGLLCAAAPYHRYVAQVDRAGDGRTTVLDDAFVQSGGAITVGLPFVYQCVFRDDAAGGCGTGFGTSSALEVVLTP